MNHGHVSDLAPSAAAPSALDVPRSALRAVVAAFTTWRRIARERRELAAIDHRTRRDLCLTQVDMIRYLEAPTWPFITAAACAAWRRT